MTSENSSEDAFLLWIREKTAENLTDKIESEVDNYGEITPQTWKIAAYNIFKKIKDMEETKRIVQNINGEIKNDIRTISRENTRQSKPKLLEERLAGAVLGQKQFQQVCRSLSYMKPLEIRIQALKCLIHSQLPDGVTKECWPFLKRNLQHCLNDQNVELFTLTLKFHIKIVSTAPHLFAKECLLNLIESLHLQYIKKSKYLPNFDIGLDLNDNGHKKLIRMAHVIIHIVKEITKNWVRFKDKWIEEIISAFLLLMTMHTTDVNTLKRCVFPIHLLSLLDPKATWCFHWLHSSLGRNIIFSMERKVLVLLKYVTEIILSSNADKHNYDINNKVSFTQLKEANFIHCLNIFINLISYKKGNNFFPIQTNVQIEPVSVPCILISLIEFVNNHPSKNSPAKEAVIDSIIKIMSKRNFIHSINKDILNALVKPLVSATNSLESIPPHTIHILCELCNYEWHLHNFLGFQSQLKASLIHFENVPEENKIEDDLIPVNTLTLYITKQLQNQDVIDIKSLSMLIQIFIRLLSISNKIVLDLFETSLISAAVCLFNRLYLNADDHANMWTLLEVVRNLLVGICSSHLGIIALIQYDNVIPLIVKLNPLLLMPILSISAPEVFAKLNWTPQQLYSSSAIITLAGMKVLLSDSVGKDKSLPNLLLLNSEDESDELQALTLLSGVLSYLDVWLYLETKFNLEKKLLESQTECAIESKVVVDEFSLLRHHIILRSYCPGGPNEQLSHDSLQAYLETMINGEINLLNALPSSFLSYTDYSEEQSNQIPLDLQKVIEETMNDHREKEWLILLRKICRTYFTAGIEAPVLLKLLEEVTKYYKDQTQLPIDWSTQVDRNLHPEEEIGIELVIRYGQRIKILKMEEHKEKLGSILKQGISRNIESFLTFDWFTSSAYLLCQGNKERCIKFLEQFSRLPVAPYIWPSFASQLGYDHVSAVLCHHLKFVCLSELPLACAALKMANVPWTTVFYTWICQSFWNVLDWPQICRWLTLNLLYPSDICVYFCVAILRHLQPHLLAASSHGNVWDCIQNPPLSDFNIGLYMAFIEKMTKRYQTETIEQLMKYTMKIKHR